MDSNRSLINHVFLPPQLPQALDDLPIDFLLRSTLEALAAFKLIRPDPILAQVVQMLENTQDIHSNGHFNEAKLTDLLNALPRKRGMLVLHIDAQNAGVIVTNTTSAIRFETFELAPLNEHVYNALGRLRRSFPGSAVDFDFTTCAEIGFVATTAHTLSKMSHQPVPGMQPQNNLAADISATHLRSSNSPAASSTSGKGLLYDSDIDHDTTLIVSEAEYASPIRRKVINLPTEAFSRGVSTEDLQAEGWTDEHILLVQKLALRGFEPLLPKYWQWDFAYLLDALFEPPGEEEKAFIRSNHSAPTNNHHFRGVKALINLMEMSGRVRDTFLSEGRMRPEVQTRKYVKQFLKWTNQDADLDLQTGIPVLAFEVQPAGTPHAVIDENARRKMARLHERYREAFRAEPSIENSPSKTRSTPNTIAHAIPQIYALIASHTLVALVAFRPDSHLPEQEVRTVAFFDLRDKDYDVWNSLAMAIVGCHVRDVRVRVAEETGVGMKVPGMEVEVDDPDA
ncbi:hypothetical protein LTR35_018148 [Friedmanniomyces endolithicus]|nr:hypothetical protein LTR35_018148 [Friedmanniomyces endolithicus]KAK0264679.1 hypothetical protein LTS00_018018 [Friedmanniomyces endolithicus]KAK0968200.1 hypothetical protein LTR54_018232 [Friedmanniomyces endolithicus]